MNLRHILLKYFLPMVASFFVLSFVFMIPTIQNTYHSLFAGISQSAASFNKPYLYFTTKKGSETAPEHPDKVRVLFNTNAYLQAIIDINRTKPTGQKVAYDYKGFELSISEYFITPLIFFFSLLLVTPGKIPRKMLNFLIGSLLIIGFAYLTVRFRSNYAIVEAGLPGMSFDPREIKGYKLLSYVFSSVTTVTVVLLTWILLAFRRSDLKNLLP